MATPCSTTEPFNGLSSVAWLTPGGVRTSSAFGTRAGLKLQIGAGLPAAQTPNWNASAVGWKPRAWSFENPSWPVSTTVNVQPLAGLPPSDDFDTLNVM